MQATTWRNCTIAACEASNTDFMRLHSIFAATLYPGMPFKAFRAFYHSRSLDYIDVTFMYAGEKLVGFCAAAFYQTEINRRPVVIGRAATGVLPDERGGKLPRWSLYAKYMLYKMKHPFTRILLTVYVANPLMYAMICKYTGIVFPRLSVNVSGKIVQLKDDILRHGNLEEKELSPFVVKIHFKVQLGEDIIKKCLASNDVFVRYYLSINPGFQHQCGVLTIVPVTWENVLRSCARLVKAYLNKRSRRLHGNATMREEKGGCAEQQKKNDNFPEQKHRKYRNDALLPDTGK